MDVEALAQAFKAALEPEEKPKLRLGGELVLETQINVMSITSINTQEESFKAKIALRLFSTNASEVKSENGDMLTTDIFEPRIRFLNLLETDMWEMKAKMLPDGNMSWKYMVQGTFYEPLELQEFPFDVQPLTMKLSTAIPAKEMGWNNAIRFEPKAAILSGFTVPNFCLASADTHHCVQTETSLSDANESGSGTIRPIMHIQTVAVRESMYYLWNIVLPMMLINGISIGTFAVPRTDVADRLGVSMTMVLTAVAFKLEISAGLPDLSYLTRLDQFVLVSFMFIGGISVENALAFYWLDDDQDSTVMYIFMAVYAIGTAFMVAAVTYKLMRLKDITRGRHQFRRGRMVSKVVPSGS